jgi:hypothetical protein
MNVVGDGKVNWYCCPESWVTDIKLNNDYAAILCHWLSVKWQFYQGLDATGNVSVLMKGFILETDESMEVTSLLRPNLGETVTQQTVSDSIVIFLILCQWHQINLLDQQRHQPCKCIIISIYLTRYSEGAWHESCLLIVNDNKWIKPCLRVRVLSLNQHMMD